MGKKPQNEIYDGESVIKVGSSLQLEEIVPIKPMQIADLPRSGPVILGPDDAGKAGNTITVSQAQAQAQAPGAVAAPSGTPAAPAIQYDTISATTYDPARSSGRTIVPGADVMAATITNAGAVAVSSGRNEKLGFIVRNPDGTLSFQSPAVQTGSTSSGSTASARMPQGAVAGLHGHIDSGRYASDGMVDDPPSNGGYGDTMSLRAGIPMATVSHGQVGWHTMVNGQLQYMYPRGSMSSAQIRQMQTNLNREQQRYQSR